MRISHEKVKIFTNKHFYDVGCKSRKYLTNLLYFRPTDKNGDIELVGEEEKQLINLFKLFNYGKF